MAQAVESVDNDESSWHGIAKVERATGISKDTLRVWERRYGFPSPQRDAQGERLYPNEQLRRLRTVKWLTDMGFRPGRVVAAPPEELEKLLNQAREMSGSSAAAGIARRSELDGYISLLRSHEVELLRRRLAQSILRRGLADCIKEVIAPLTTEVGEAWMRGELQVFEEHIYSECLQHVLRPAIHGIQRAVVAEGPRVLLTTLPGEQHGLGLLMVEALLALEGCHCLSLGVETPLVEILRAAAAQRADIVALSFTGRLPASAVLDELRQLRDLLPAAVELWVGGKSGALRRAPAGTRHLAGLADLGLALAQWGGTRAATGLA
ncbi:MerR family transcriptional regulator [Pelomonas sp. SE-A7]|uniref:MerR family transcriptional regulator n=1 Tax=Pelomonas sp. SE-A7 TaxID=3054953 RepID=UPI00259CD336|nr:MerR family transcriptional regulator [Pelomonas sp. SE-A7]MDM4766949.1 MerR family transcriptional regulator [Pelomonas sp. SE-A7]